MANIFTAIGNFIFKVFSKILGEDLAHSLAVTVENLAKDTFGKLAVDAVEWVEVNVDGSSVEKRDAAVAKLISDAKAAGKDAESLGTSLLNTLVELAVQYIKAKTE